jgi:menaquinone-9 beta-reductase
MATSQEREVAGAVNREAEDVAIIREQCGRAVAPVDVGVDDGEAIRAAPGLHRSDRDGHIIENAEALAPVGEGVVRATRQVDACAVLQRRPGRGDGRADRPPRATRPGKSDAPDPCRRQCPGHDPLEVGGIVHARQRASVSGAPSAQVLVVGAGPAGSATALLLARAGYDVLILDRHDFPRAKPCGDCLSAAATPLLHRLGVLQDVQRLPHARLPGWRIFAPDGVSFTARFDDARAGTSAADAADAMAIERASLDAALLRAAIAAGARFLGDTRVVDVIRGVDGTVHGVLTRDGPLRAKLTVGADGLRSIVARRLGAVTRPPRLRKLSLTLHFEGPRRAWPAGEMHVGDGICAGLAPVTGDGARCNLTIVADADRFGRLVAADRRAFVERAVHALPALRGRLPTTALDGTSILTSGPFDRPVGRTVFHGAALVGDAAGYYDPFTGQGVHHALRAAELLAATADRALQHDDCSARRLAPYAAAVARLQRGPRVVQHGIEFVVGRPRLARFAIGRIRTAPAFAAALVAVTGDLAPATRLLAPAVLATLFRSA